MWIKLEQYVSLTASWLKSQADKWKQTQLYVNEKGLRRQPLLPEAPQPAGLPSWGLPLLPPPPPALTLEALKRGLLSAPHPASALAKVASCPSTNPLCAAHSCPQSSPMLCSLRRCVCVCVRSLRSCPPLCDPWTAARQAPLSMGFSRQEHRSGLPCLPPRDLPSPGIEPVSPELQAGSLPTKPPGKPSL